MSSLSVYAKIKKAAPLSFLLFLTLAACGGASVPFNTGTFSKDPKSLPDIAWQTSSERKTLSEENKDFAATPPQPATPAPAPKKAVVALLIPLTGKSADLGQGMLKAAQMALFDVGSANIALQPRDTQSTKEGAAAAAEAAVAAKADLILGPVFADDLKVVKPIAARSQTPVVSFTTDWAQAGGDTYIMGFLPFAQAARVEQYAQGKGLTHLAIFAPETEYCNVVITTMQRGSARIDRISRFATQQSDLSAIVKDFVSTSKEANGKLKFDGLVLPIGGESLRTVVSLLDAEGVTGKDIRFIGTGLWDDPALAGYPPVHGGWYAAPDPRLRADFEKRYQENYETAPPRLASLAYDATALAAVLARTEPAAPYSRANMTNPRGFAGIDGIFRFRADGMAERGLAVLELASGKPRLVDPAPTAFANGG
jgi:ABC-type branched-subunit amino acid transport system substrate-binding protein